MCFYVTIGIDSSLARILFISTYLIQFVMHYKHIYWKHCDFCNKNIYVNIILGKG
jgi:hypothetical protein